ncbi:MAG TPA: NIL domain-containing protein [Planctomycetota bacterium]|jgi:ABC-type methionine transport system ATPase subunit|nr:NIL domain-containing protein [Planctomycetota bacterium]
MAARESRKSARYKMTFPQKIVGEPIMTKLAQDFNVTYNMMRGRISEKGAWLDVELIGPARNIEKALKYLSERGVTIQPLEG